MLLALSFANFTMAGGGLSKPTEVPLKSKGATVAQKGVKVFSSKKDPRPSDQGLTSPSFSSTAQGKKSIWVRKPANEYIKKNN